MLLVNHTGSMTSGRRPSTMLWGHTGAKCVALRMSGHGAAGSGGWKRRSPVGGAAYGTPRNCMTGPRISLFSSFLIPRSLPLAVVTIGSFSSSFWANTTAGHACRSSNPSHIRVDTHQPAFKEPSRPTYPMLLLPHVALWSSRHPILECCLHSNMAAVPRFTLGCFLCFWPVLARETNSLFPFSHLYHADANTNTITKLTFIQK